MTDVTAVRSQPAAMLMLIDTADPRYRPEEPDEPERRWQPNPRVWLPLIAAVTCLIVARVVPPLPGYLLAMLSLGLFLHGAFALLPTGDGLPKHKQ